MDIEKSLYQKSIISSSDGNIVLKELNKKKEATEKKGYISSFSSIFFKKSKANDIKEEFEDYNDDYYDGTTLIDDYEVKRIKIKGVDTPREISIVIDKDYFILGSSYNSADGVISFNKAISRKHCCISKDTYYLTDIGSLNGTFVNGVKLLQGDSVEIKAGDKIKLANSSFSIENT